MMSGLAALVAASLCLAVGPLDAQTAEDPYDPAFIPRGVYWPGEYSFGEPYNAVKIGGALSQLRDMNVNTIWFTHKDAGFTAELARQAAPYGISVVASLDIFAGNEVNVRGRTNAQHISMINSVLSTWGDAPQPIAWGLGDEADPANADYQRWVGIWNQNFPTQPTTAVHMWNQIDAAQASLAYQKSLTCDIYPFRPGSSGAGGFPGGAVKGLDRSTRHVVNSPASMRPWMMVAAYQERHSGPTYYDAEGNYCYGANGAATHFAVSRAQARWQAWKSVANGAKGVFFFAYRLENWMNYPGAAPSTASWRYVDGFNTGEPAGLVYTSGTKSGQPSSACLGMADAYAKIKALSPLLGRLELIKAPEAWLAGAATTDGPHLAVFRDPQTEARYLLAIAGQNGDANTPKSITFKVGPHITGLIEYVSGNTVPVAPDGQGCAMATASLLPGDAVFYSCTLDAGNMPVSYFDDFETNRYQTDGVSWIQVSSTNNYSGYGRCLQSNTSSGAASNHVVYDLNSLLAPLPAGGLRILQYDGDSTAGDRGAFWWKSNTASFSGSAWSSNVFNSEVPAFTNRYLRVGIARTDGASYAYGNLNRFGIAQWASTPLPVTPSVFQWDGGSATDAGWNQTANWDTTPVFDPAADIVFHASGAARLSNFLQTARTIRSLTFNALSDSAVTIRTTTTATGTTAADLTFETATGSASITVDGGANGNHTLGAGAGSIVLKDDLVVTHNGSGTLTLGRPVTGSFSLTKNGSGEMILSAANTFSGSTTVIDGTLVASAAGALGSTGDVTVETNGSGTRLKLGNSSCLAFNARLHANTGGEARIDLTGNNHVLEFTIDGVPQAGGRWGRIGHPLADHTSDTFTGDGLLGVGVLSSVSYHVTTAGADTNTGIGWDDAFLTLSKALAEAKSAVALGASNATIHVGAGTFQSTGELLMDAAITIVGGNQPGFEGQSPVIRGNGSTGNFRVFRLTHPAARLEGLTVENGYSGSTSAPNPGSGANIRMSAGTVTYCLIRTGTVRDGALKGAGIFMSGGTVEDCRILNNRNFSASSGTTAYGGGVYQTGGELRRCRVGANYFDIGSSNPSSITVHGAGICVDGAAAIVESCLIDNNYAPNTGTVTSAGGGVHLTTSGGAVRNCTITENEVRKTTITHTGGGLWQAGGTVLNCIVAGNTVAAATSGDYADGGSLRDITYSCAPELGTGTGNLAAEPRFASPATGDFRPAPDSPCLDSGLDQPWMSTTTDLDGQPRQVGIVDMGCYEAPATDAYTNWFAPYPTITGANRAPDIDFDNDGLPNGIEFVIGSNPETFTGPNTPGYPSLTTSGGSVTYTFKRSTASKAYEIRVETSADLRIWPPAASYLIPTTDGTAAPVTVSGEHITVTLPLASDTRKFLRLRAIIAFTP